MAQQLNLKDAKSRESSYDGIFQQKENFIYKYYLYYLGEINADYNKKCAGACVQGV